MELCYGRDVDVCAVFLLPVTGDRSGKLVTLLYARQQQVDVLGYVL